MKSPRNLIPHSRVISFDEKDRIALYNKALEEVRAAFPDYRVTASLDTDFSLTE